VSKGSARRPTNESTYRSNWSKIYGIPDRHEGSDSLEQEQDGRDLQARRIPLQGPRTVQGDDGEAVLSFKEDEQKEVLRDTGIRYGYQRGPDGSWRWAKRSI
jgi:hypothetical protein